MPELQVHHLVPFAPLLMFDVVADIESYPQFVPYCSFVRILSRDKKSEGMEIMTARLGVRYKVLEQHYTSRVTLDREAMAIDVSQLEGPLDYLINTWRFEKAGEGAKIHFYLNYELRSRSLSLFIGPLFQKLFRNFEAAFEQRAQELYARNQSIAGDKAQT
jgi:coenzyme Q-binding protein COQ10